MRTFILPDLGEGLHEAEIVAWHVSVGDTVVADQPLVSVETDKAVVEIPAPWSGRISALHGAPGDIVETGHALVDFDEGTATEFTGIVGEVPTATPPTPVPAGRGTTPAPRAPVTATGIVQASPAVRALAKRLGVDLSEVTPTGPGGLATAADVERAAKTPSEDTTFEALRGPRRAMAESMTRSGAEVVPATITDEADVDAWTQGTSATVRLVRAICVASAAEPALNAWLESGATGRRVHNHVDLGIAVDTPDGLFVPVLRNAGTLDAVAILGAGRATPQVVAANGQPVVHRMLPLSLTVDHRAVAGGEAARFMAAVVADLQRPE